MTGYRDIHGVDFVDLFDPDIVGDGLYAPNDRMSNGVGMQFANIQYGQQGPDTGYRTAAGIDFAKFWARKGSAVYTLPMNGARFTCGDSAPNKGTAQASETVTFDTDGTYNVTSYRAHAGQGGTPIAGNLVQTRGTWNTFGQPASAMQIAISGNWTLDQSGGTSSGVWGDGSWQTVNTAIAAGRGLTVGFQGGSKDLGGTMVIQIRYASTSQVVSTTSIYIQVSVDGSV